MMYPYILLRSNRKTIAMEITKDLQVLVRAPRRTPQKEIERFVALHGRWIETHIVIQKERNSYAEKNALTPAQAEQLKAKAKEILPQRVAHYSAVMGLIPQGVKITSAKTRFGSCSGKNSLCFSYLLLRYPMEAVDYVVVHELAHIRYKNHGKDFYQLIQTYMPDYQRRRALLKQYG